MGISIEQIVMNDQKARDMVAAARDYRKSAEENLKARQAQLTEELKADAAHRADADAEQREKRFEGERTRRRAEMTALREKMDALYAEKKDEWADAILRSLTEVKQK